MHVTGTKADLFSSSYFKKVQGERKPVNPFNKWVNGRLFIFGVLTDEEKGDTQRVVIDLTAAREPCEVTADTSDPFTEICTCLQKDVTKTMYFSVTNPIVPPSRSFIMWAYHLVIKEHQFSSWISNYDDKGEKIPYTGHWEATTQREYRYLKNGEMIAPTLVDLSSGSVLAEDYHTYYFVNSYDFKYDTLITLEGVKTGDNLKTLRNTCQAAFEKKYPERAKKGEIDIKLYTVDFSEADHVDTETEHNTSLMGYWLGKYETYPTMLSVDQNENIIATYGSHNELNMECDFEYRHSLPDAVFDFKKKLVERSTTLPICNGLCCYPRIVDGKIYASQGQRLSYNKACRDRRWILVDFSPVGGCEFVHLSDLKGRLSEMYLPASYDATKQSLLLVVGGRLFTPDEFDVLDGRLMFDLTKFKAVYELDRRLCRGDLIWNTDVIDVYKSSVDRSDRVIHETIKVYQKTTDTEFQDAPDKTYYVQFHDEFYPVDVEKYALIGEPIDKKLYAYDIGFKDEHDQPILFSTFFEYVDKEIYGRFEKHITGDKHKKETWEYLSSVNVTVAANKLDLKNDDNSFLIIINKPNLQVVRHPCYHGTWPMTKMARGVDSFAGMMKNDFDQQARGLLFDESTRSVMDYSREVQTMTFYADKIRKWGI